MEQLRKTSCDESLPSGSRNNKRKLVFECCQNKKPSSSMVLDVQQGREIDAAPNLPCVHIHFDSKMCAKEMEKIIWSLQNGMMNGGAATRSKLNLGVGGGSSTSEQHLDQKKKEVQLQDTEDGHSGNSTLLENEDVVKKTQAQSYSNTTRRFQVQHDDDQSNSCPDQKRVREAKARTKAKNILNKFRDHCYKLSVMKQKQDILNEENGKLKRVDLQSAKKVKSELGYITGKQQYIGEVPGIRIGDRFYYRMELHILGLHRPPQSGIETMDYEGRKIATSIVVSGGYNDYWKDANTLIYFGHGGGNYGSGGNNQEQIEDQKLKGGNLALLNSKGAKNPVRVIRKERKMKAYYYDQFTTVYTYDGLYTVEDMWKIRDSVHRKTVFNFKLVKITGHT